MRLLKLGFLLMMICQIAVADYRQTLSDYSFNFGYSK